MNTVFDFMDVLNMKIREHLAQVNENPTAVFVSPFLYRRLLEIKSNETAIGNIVIGSSPVTEIRVMCGKLAIVIDEMLSETSIEITYG